MKRNRQTPEQAVRKVREGERMLGSGTDLAEVWVPEPGSGAV